ncbi:MAG: DUF3239 domain-containing protein [Planctomycetota bacterium]
MTIFLDDSTQASAPGALPVEYSVYLLHHPSAAILALAIFVAPPAVWALSDSRAMAVGALGFAVLLNLASWWSAVERFRCGDTCAAMVVSRSPGLIAVSTDLSKGQGEYYVIKILPANLDRLPGATDVLSRVATVATYQDWPEGESRPYWADFFPEPCGWVTSNLADIRRVTNTIEPWQWKLLKAGLEEVPKPFRPGLYPVSKPDFLSEPPEITQPALRELFDRHALVSFAKRSQLDERIGEHGWSFSAEEGRLSLEGDGGSETWEVQLLGASGPDGRFSWAWAERGLPARLLRTAEELRAFGRKQGIELLTKPALHPTELAGIQVALIACGWKGAPAFYDGVHEHGALFFLITDPAYPEPPAATPLQLNRFAELIGVFPIHDQRLAFTEYARFLGFEVSESDGVLHAGGFEASFDEQGRLARLQGTVRPGDV